MPRLGSDLPLFARDRELATLRDALDQARSGRPAAVIVSGDAGVGKSRLLHEFDTIAGDGALTVAGHCLDTADSALPYLPFAEAAGSLSRLRPELVAAHPGLRPLLPGLSEPAEGELGRLGLFEALHTALADLAAEQPVVLTVEDLHWSDRSSRDLLAFLASRLVDQRLLIVGTYRADALHRTHPLRRLLAEMVRLPAVQRLHVDPFDTQHAIHFVRELNSGLDEETVAKIAAASEGNAFLAEELAAAETHTVTFELAEVLLARTERLPETAQQVVRLASAMGRQFTYQRLNAAVWSLLDETGIKSERELDQALRAAISHGIIVQKSNGTYAFRHALLREAVYTDLLPGERSRYHHRIAESLADDTRKGAAAELAHHAHESGDLPTALSASVQATREAVELAAPAEALLHLERALRLFDRVPAERRPDGVSELRLTLIAAGQAEACGEIKRALAYSSEAVALADRDETPVQAAACRRKYAKHLLAVEGNEEEAHRICGEAWDLVKDDEPHPTMAWVQAVMARACNSLGDHECATGWAERTIATADAIDGTGPHIAAKADAMITAASADFRTGGDIDRSVQRCRQALELAGGGDWKEVELRAHFVPGIFFVEHARIAECLEYFERGLARARETGQHWSSFGLETAVRLVVCNFILGRWDEADAAGAIASSVLPGVVVTRLAAAALLVDVARGRFDVADRRLAYLSDRWQIDGQVLCLAGLCGTELERWRGRPERGVEIAERTADRLQNMSGYHLAGVSVTVVGIGAAADLAHRRRRDGDTDGAEHAVRSGERLADRGRYFLSHGRPLSGTIGPEGRAWAAQLEAEADRLDGGGDPDLWCRVHEAFAYAEAGEGEPYRQAYAQWRLSESLLARGTPDDRAEAAANLAEAKRTAAGLGATPLLGELTALSERARLDLPGNDSGPLTPRELSVLRLVAKGLTNRRIGTELYISEKTVSVHLSRAMAKLEVSNRTEAVNAAHLRGYLTEA
ncbi:helix-turn-helix transcriptional regulator [Glycomyces xiaoerkulensis]|uniref:helix-turn-helix transcriptional regulator n=1 Tax=Glycomyces xiaoerkulensis TaxID=2038139 RepID=UPI0018E4B9B3|nr:helix-turn-helix transcriptional regulator [Glycomyces xiaoerkulensis]